MKITNFCILLLSGLMVFSAVAAEENKPELVVGGDNLLAPVWNEFRREATVAPEKVPGPDGKLNAFALNTKAFWGQIIRQAVPGKTYRFTVWMKSATGKTQNVTLMGENNAKGSTVAKKIFPVTPEWKSYSLDYQCPEAGNSNFRFSIRIGDLHVFQPSVTEVK